MSWFQSCSLDSLPSGSALASLGIQIDIHLLAKTVFSPAPLNSILMPLTEVCTLYFATGLTIPSHLHLVISFIHIA